MEREEFLKSLGISLALVCAGSCFTACSKNDDEPNQPEGGTKVTVDLSQSIKEIGQQAVSNGVLIYRIAAGNQPSSFVATERVCPHQAGNLNWVQADNKVVCDLHSAKYSTDGTVLSNPVGGGQTRKLKIYAVTIDGNTLTINKA